MIPTRPFVSVFLGGFIVLSTAAADAQVKFFGVGDLPGGIVQSEVHDATRVGNVLYAVGGSAANAGSPGNDTAFLWTSAGGIAPLPDLATVAGATSLEIASAITPDAAYIASRARFNPANAQLLHAVRVSTSGPTNLDLGTLTGFPQFSAATAISDDGAVLYGVAYYGALGKVQAVRYDAAGPTVTAIPFLNASDDFSFFFYGHASSSDGMVAIGTSRNSALLVDNYGYPHRAFRYVHGTGVSAIPLLPGGTWNYGAGVSPDGKLALVGGDTPASPLGEVYLYNAATAATTSLGAPLPGWKLFGAGGMTSDGAIRAITVNDPDGALKAGFIHNAAGWHDVQTIVSGAGVDLTGWTLDVVQGISSDGVRIWGSGIHGGNMEGWVAEFPAGYLAAYGASLPAQAIVGAWTGTDTTTEGAEVIVFLGNGTYFDIADARASAAAGFDGYERGTYTWDPVSKAFTLTTLVDTNGDYGASGISGLSGMTADVLNNYFSVNFPAPNGAYSAPLVVGSSPIVGGWVFGDTTVPGSSALVVFFPNGTYLLADDTGPADATGQPGMERGTYTWDPSTGAFTANAIVDTDGARGFSNLVPGTTVTIVGGTLTLTMPTVGAFTFARVRATPMPPTQVVAESRKTHGLPGIFDLVLRTATSNPTIEPRFGPMHSLVFIFDKPVTGGVAAVTEGTALLGAPSFSGHQMTVPMTGVIDQQYVTVGVSSVTSADGGSGGTGSIRIGFLAGDVNQNRVVTLSDLGQVNAQIAQFVTTANFLKDVNASGTLSLADKGLTNTQLTKTLPAP